MAVGQKFQGLSENEVSERVRAGQTNAPVEAPFKSGWQIVRDNTFTYFNGVFLVLALILAAVRSYRDLTFLPIIIANTLIGIFQEFRAKSVLEKLTVLSAQTAVVYRGGEKQEIPVSGLVLDDVMLLKAGDQIAADAEVLDGQVAVNEALLTGEADEIQKTSGAELLSGSFISSGECVAKVTKVGADAYAAKLTLRAKAIKTEEQSEIIRSLNKLVKYAGIAIVPIGVLLFSQQYFLHGASAEAAVQGMAAAVIGMIPEGLFLLSSVALAISAMKLAQNKVLVHEMKSVETLAHVDVLCVDKTGTITSPEMSVQGIVPLAKNPKSDPAATLAIFCHSQATDNATMQALQDHFKKPKVEASQVQGFSPKYKYSAAAIDNKNYVLGAPEFILRDQYEAYKSQIDPYTRKGYRALVFAAYQGALRPNRPLSAKVLPQALIILENPVRETAAETFQYFAAQGVRIMVISGDNALTVSEVAKNAQIENAHKFIDASRLKTDADYAKAAQEYTVFGRVLPEQKRKIVKALQDQGHTVAMTGDGVNDVLALKDADCSIAMASGSQAASQAAQLVLLDSDFSKMPGVVKEGRRVVNNLERSGSLFIVKNVFSFIAAVLVIILGFSYPLLPAQVSMVTMWIIGTPSFFLSQMPNHDLIHGDFMSNILKKAIPGGLTNVVLILSAYVLFKLLGVGQLQIYTACTIVFAISGLSYLYRVCQPFDWYRKLVWGGCAVGLLACFTLFRWGFAIESDMPLAVVLASFVIGLLAYPLLKYLNQFGKKVETWRENRKK